MNINKIKKELKSGKTLQDLELRVTYYARTANGNIDDQENYLKNIIDRTGKWTYVEGYTDENKSGVNISNREGLLNMLQHSSNNKFDFVLIEDISRLSRNKVESLEYINKLIDNDVGVLFVTENINTLEHYRFENL